uniref:SWIM-type domain-containing protein n=1 Tax=Ditylenchus dipsaci TaxID=166011 RepID=A0A915DTB1_9BILA
MSLQLIEEPNKRGNQINYKKAASFDGDDAKDELQLWKQAEGNEWSNGKWRMKRRAGSEKHIVENFDCSYSRRIGCECKALLRIRRPAISQEIFVEVAAEHSNHESTDRRRISSPVKQNIKKKFEDGKTAQLIKQDLMNTPNVTNVPFLRQIQNFSAYQKKSDLSPSTLKDLRDYAASKQNEPAYEDEEPAICPKISPEVFKEAYQLEQEKRPFLRSPQNNLFVMPSSSARDKNTADLYEKLLQGGWTFLQLKEYKAAFHVIVPSLVWPNHFSCSCKMGGKKAHCKHSVMVMKKQGQTTYPRHAIAEPLGKKRKRGRPSQG